MRLEVWKFPLPFDDVVTVEMPAGSKVIHFATQYDMPCIWALVNPSADKEKRTFRIAGTGHPIESDSRPVYLGTVLVRGGSLVFHCFEVSVL